RFILSYAIFGILSILLVYLVRKDAENKWIRLFNKLFYFSLIPLLIFLLLGIMLRINAHGMTDYYYIILILSFWLSFITVMYLIKSANMNIKWIPVSLSILGIIAAYGPLSSSYVSRTAQLRSLKKDIEKAKTDESVKPRDLYRRIGYLE